MKHSDYFILFLRLAVALTFLEIGYSKIEEGWLTSDTHLQKSLSGYHDNARGLQKTFLEKVSIPLSAVWSPLIALGEIALGISLFIGLFTRLSTMTGLIMVLIFHLTNGNLFSFRDFIGSAWGIMTCVSLLVLFLTRSGYRWGLDAMIGVTVSKRKGKSSRTKVN
ncbi:MAG: DoxX family protein [Ignavibacteriales bacterium]|nr:DoxX family protein [Ignavibacteriales bacterium]